MGTRMQAGFHAIGPIVFSLRGIEKEGLLTEIELLKPMEKAIQRELSAKKFQELTQQRKCQEESSYGPWTTTKELVFRWDIDR